MKSFKHILTAALFVLASSAFAGPVNINTAGADALAELKGVGENKAAAIVAYREANGPFTSIQDLAKVKGIGARTVELNKAEIILQEVN
ncbi:MAG: ComEA family DNA-binding protein [Gammaproteobacteria bacterium]